MQDRKSSLYDNENGEERKDLYSTYLQSPSQQSQILEKNHSPERIKALDL